MAWQSGRNLLAATRCLETGSDRQFTRRRPHNRCRHHIWRQRSPDAEPQQVTSGVTEEEGIEFAPDGRSFVTSIGTSQSTVWFHDSRGDRQVTAEGDGFLPSISPDGKKMYYLVRAGGGRH